MSKRIRDERESDTDNVPGASAAAAASTDTQLTRAQPAWPDIAQLAAVRTAYVRGNLAGPSDLNRHIATFLDLVDGGDGTSMLAVSRAVGQDAQVVSYRVRVAKYLHSFNTWDAYQQSAYLFGPLHTPAWEAMPPTHQDDLGLFTDSVRIRSRRDGWNAFLAQFMPPAEVRMKERQFHHILRHVAWPANTRSPPYNYLHFPERFKTGPAGSVGLTLSLPECTMLEAFVQLEAVSLDAVPLIARMFLFGVVAAAVYGRFATFAVSWAHALVTSEDVGYNRKTWVNSITPHGVSLDLIMANHALLHVCAELAQMPFPWTDAYYDEATRFLPYLRQNWKEGVTAYTWDLPVEIQAALTAFQATPASSAATTRPSQ